MVTGLERIRQKDTRVQKPYVERIEAFEDNYIWALRWRGRDDCILVDPGDPAVACHYLESQQLRLTAIWNTHHHPDHTGGNLELKRRYRCSIVGSAEDSMRLPGLDWRVRHGDVVGIAGDQVKVIASPGHTLGALCYWLPGSELLFCGDTLFSLGCGRMFEGSAEVFWESLLRIRALPPGSLIFCAHEYTMANAAFARSLTPEDRGLQAYIGRLKHALKFRKSTLPVRLADERRYNPFLKADQVGFREALEFGGGFLDPVSLFAQIRSMKDNWVA